MIYIRFQLKGRNKILQILDENLNYSYCIISYFIQVLVVLYLYLNIITCIVWSILSILMYIRCKENKATGKCKSDSIINDVFNIYYYFALDIIAIFMRMISVSQIYEWESMKWIIVWQKKKDF